MNLFPLFLKLEGRPCLVVGAGTIAAPKIESLLHVGGQVTVVAPEALPVIAAWADENKIRWIEREFLPTDLDGALLVVTATNQKIVNHAVAEAARAKGILCNSVDDPPDCDFYYGSVVERGSLQVAISTAGKSPALAQRLREELSALIADDTDAWLDQLGERRLRILSAVPPGEERKQALHLLARREACNPSGCPVEAMLTQSVQAISGAARAGTVYLVGAGPGLADLLTVRAHRLIQSASCILHDDLVSAEVLALARADALIVNVGKRCGQKRVTQQQIHEWMIAYARNGQSVVRLKSGDPLLFGRAAEEIAALAEATVPYEVVPGVSAAFAAAAAAQVSLTDRDRSARVVLTTRHRAGNQPVFEDSPAAASIAASSAFHPGLDADSTLAIYMPGRDYAALKQDLLSEGWPPEAHCLLVSSAGAAAQQIAVTTVDQLDQLTPLPAPVTILVLPNSGK
jgi:uroporphyrin-III C-methyltransferase/precorrin-2 dehydrogenase/sirohydrochlorin ferrochelatase